MMNRQFCIGNSLPQAIQAAEGWLALGAARSAWEELAALESALQKHPAALHVRARVQVALGELEEAKTTVRLVARLDPARRLALLNDPALEPVWR